MVNKRTVECKNTIDTIKIDTENKKKKNSYEGMPP